MIYKNHLSSTAGNRLGVPATMNLGSGKDWREDCLNVDILPRVFPDLCLDICAPIQWGIEINTVRFKTFCLNKGIFQRIIANDVLEHVPDLQHAMRVCLDLLCEGGEFDIHVPYDLSYGAWQDPTHVRAFNERSWLYYCEWHWYLGWTDYRFMQKNLQFILSDYGEELKTKFVADELIIKTPRAVDSMRVTLKKIKVV